MNIYDLTDHKIKETYERLLQISASDDSVVRDGFGEPITSMSISGSIAAYTADLYNVDIISGSTEYLIIDGTRIKKQLGAPGTTTHHSQLVDLTSSGHPSNVIETDDGAWTFLSSTNTSVKLALDEIDTVLGKLAPVKPSYLSEISMSMTTYLANRSDEIATTTDICTDNTSPVGICSNFFDGDRGILSAKINLIDVGSITLSPSSSIESNVYLNVTSITDPYVGQAGKQGFWRQITANITPLISLPVAQYTYSMVHSITGECPPLNFYVDDPGIVTIDMNSVTASGGNTEYISGVPTIATGESINIKFRLANAVRSHYARVRVAAITSIGNITNSPSISPQSTPYSNGDFIYVDQNVTVYTNKYTENTTFYLYGYNSKAVGYNILQNTNFRVDTVSDESIRKTSGNGQYPITGYGLSYDSSLNLKTQNIDELQLLNGRYVFPSMDYSSNLPTSGPDYSSGMGNDIRWVTFNPISIVDKSFITITFNSSLNFGSSTLLNNMYIYVKVEGDTGWIDANAAYSGVGSPVNDGDSALVIANSSSTIKRVTFGVITRTGQVYVRIGLPSGSNKSFASITVN